VTADNHRCLIGPVCRGAVTVDDERLGATTADPDTFCPACIDHIASCTKQLARDWQQLRNALGERAASTGEYVRSTPTPVIPISATKERLMVDIVEIADRAAAVISDALQSDQPDGRRRPPPEIHTVDPATGGPKIITVEEGSPAGIAENLSHPGHLRRLTAAVAIVEPHIGLLATDTDTAAQIWRTPRRCAIHAEPIADAETALAAELDMPNPDTATPKETRAYLRRQFRIRQKAKTRSTDDIDDAMEQLRQAFAQAASCDDCNGWDPRLGQARELIDITGVDIALDIIELHNRARAELGKTRLRHRYAMPCPRCAGRVGRDDGTTVVDCDSCKASWTEREYKFLAGLIADEGKTMEILKYLLVEGYSRLDDVQALLDKIAGDERINVSGTPVAFLIAELQKAMAGHARPADREAATDKAASEERQTDEDTWTWQNETPYRPPRRKKPKPPPVADLPRIAASSLSTINDDPTYQPDTNDRHRVCGNCNVIHPTTEDCSA
jgi:hypothetical protein